MGFPEFEHNQWTFEGDTERLGAFARGAATRTGWRRTAAKSIALAILAPPTVAIIARVIELVAR